MSQKRSFETPVRNHDINTFSRSHSIQGASKPNIGTI